MTVAQQIAHLSVVPGKSSETYLTVLTDLLKRIRHPDVLAGDGANKAPAGLLILEVFFDGLRWVAVLLEDRDGCTIAKRETGRSRCHGGKMKWMNEKGVCCTFFM